MRWRDASGAVRAVTLTALLLLNGCSFEQFWVLRPRGPVAGASVQAIILDLGAMMLIIGPTTLLLAWCIWRYRKATGRGAYRPKWENSLVIEIVSWGFPLAIVTFLSYHSYLSTFQVNPFAPGVMARGLNADNNRDPINVDVVTTDWQWLFIYPDQHIAAANELVVPVHTPIRFRLTSATVANDIFIPQLMGQIDIMPGMQTKHGLIANQIGVYQGLEADFNGPGFSWMQFKTKVVSQAAFDQWVTGARQSSQHMDKAGFDRFALPTINDKGTVTLFSQAQNGLFDNVIEEIMAGREYTTPPGMVEKKASQMQGEKQQDGPSPASKF